MNIARRRLLVVPILGICLPAIDAATAQEGDVSHHRQVYREINDGASHMRKVTASLPGSDSTIFLTGWVDGGELRKITASPGMNGAGFDEIYLENGQPLFIFSTVSKHGAGSTEDRIYLENGEIVKWISTDPAFVAHGEDQASVATRLADDVPRYTEALNGREGGGEDGKVEGVFTGIEQGDYPHWKLREEDGTERSFFILETNDAIERVLADPQEYEGRACRVRWERRSENIPEAGGPMEIDVLLGVEWQ
jgi:hypothetical protein